MRGKTIGDQELALLQYIDEHAPASVGEVAGGYGEARGLARSTVLTMMERLRAKGYLQRQQQDVYRYQATACRRALQGAVAIRRQHPAGVGVAVRGLPVAAPAGQRQRTGRAGSAGCPTQSRRHEG
jgi:hypothetical protein